MITGTLEYVDTTDATATANDILKNKTAYSQNEKITGTIETYDGTYEGNATEDSLKITDARYLFYNNARTDYMNEFLALCKNVIRTDFMFYQCSHLTNLDLSNFDTSNVTSMDSMFYDCDHLTSLDVSNFDTSKVTNMAKMFYYCTNLKSLDVSNFDTSKVTDMNGMFANCSDVKNLDVSNFDTSNVTSMYGMFSSCVSLSNLDLSNFNTSNVKNIYNMFYYCRNLISLDISNFDASKVDSISGIFTYCNILENIIGGFKNLGKGYTQKSNNVYSYKLDLSSCRKLTHDSLMSIINNLYDLNLTYDVANGGTLYTQSLSLGSTNIAKLTEEEIAIATSKGWNVT